MKDESEPRRGGHIHPFAFILHPLIWTAGELNPDFLLARQVSSRWTSSPGRKDEGRRMKDELKPRGVSRFHPSAFILSDGGSGGRTRRAELMRLH